MSGFTKLLDQPAKTMAIVVAAVFSISSAAAGATCGICDTEIVINSELASCFLEQYDKLAKLDEQAIVVDLSDCAGIARHRRGAAFGRSHGRRARHRVHDLARRNLSA